MALHTQTEAAVLLTADVVEADVPEEAVERGYEQQWTSSEPSPADLAQMVYLASATLMEGFQPAKVAMVAAQCGIKLPVTVPGGQVAQWTRLLTQLVQVPLTYKSYRFDVHVDGRSFHPCLIDPTGHHAGQRFPSQLEVQQAYRDDWEELIPHLWAATGGSWFPPSAAIQVAEKTGSLLPMERSKFVGATQWARALTALSRRVFVIGGVRYQLDEARVEEGFRKEIYRITVL